MKEGFVSNVSGTPTEQELEKINKLSRRILSPEEVFVFSVILCDNEVDRDFERFSDDMLQKLATLFVGKTGIFDHSMKGRDQVARIFECEVERVEGQTTKRGDPYVRLKARAYMPNSIRNKDIILEIDAGIKKEVSVGCSVSSVHCSVCGADMRTSHCEHKKGRFYRKDGVKQLCHHVLSDPTDAYEWSFVAVPAQPKAGVVKAFNCNKKGGFEKLNREDIIKSLNEGNVSLEKDEANALYSYINELKEFAEAGKKQLDVIKKEVSRLGGIAEPELGVSFFEKLTSNLDFDQLSALKKAFEKRTAKFFPPARQLDAVKEQNENSTNTKFII